MSRFETENKIKIRHLILSFVLIFWGWQYHEYSKSFDSCQTSLQEVKNNLKILRKSISELETMISQK